jgi:hypothetical protein
VLQNHLVVEFLVDRMVVVVVVVSCTPSSPSFCSSTSYVVHEVWFLLRVSLEVQPVFLQHACYQVFEGADQIGLPAIMVVVVMSW